MSWGWDNVHDEGGREIAEGRGKDLEVDLGGRLLLLGSPTE